MSATVRASSRVCGDGTGIVESRSLPNRRILERRMLPSMAAFRGRAPLSFPSFRGRAAEPGIQNRNVADWPACCEPLLPEEGGMLDSGFRCAAPE